MENEKTLSGAVKGFAKASLIILAILVVLRLIISFAVMPNIEKYSPAGVVWERILTIDGFMCVASFAVLIIFGAWSFVSSKNGGSEKKAGKGICALGAIVLVLALIAAAISGGMYSLRERIDILPRKAITFNMTEVYGDDVKLSKNFEENVYDYYVTVAGAYNRLKLDGDSTAFLKAVASTDEEFDKQLLGFTDLNAMGAESVSGVADIIAKNCVFSGRQLPANSIYKGFVKDEAEGELRAGKKNKGSRRKTGHRSEVIDTICADLNVMFDILCHKELISEGKINYSKIKHNTEKEKNSGTNLEITKMKMNKKGNGSIEFTYKGQKYKEKIKGRMVRFELYGEKSLIHITSQAVTVNNSGEGPIWI